MNLKQFLNSGVTGPVLSEAPIRDMITTGPSKPASWGELGELLEELDERLYGHEKLVAKVRKAITRVGFDFDGDPAVITGMKEQLDELSTAHRALLKIYNDADE